MSQLWRCYHNREFNDYSFVEKLRPSSCPAFWHVKVIISQNPAKVGKELHVAEDMLELPTEQPYAHSI